MEPALFAGDNILVNKWVMGGRLFDIWDASEKKNVEISRLPGFGKVKHNDVLVFNFPYPGRWDSLPGTEFKDLLCKALCGCAG